MSVNNEYMRRYRQTVGGKLRIRVQNQATALAAKWVRAEHPDVWAELTAKARADVGLWVGEKPIAHGTYRGARRHRYRDEPLCDTCRMAENEYSRARYAQKRAAS